MGIISKTEPLPRMKRRMAVFIEDEKWGVIDARLFREAGLSEGKTITREIWEKLIEQEKGPALDGALYYLGLKARTRYELELYFKRRQYEPQVIDSVMSKLEDYGFVDDEALAQRTVESLSRQKMGRGAIERKLRMRGVEKEIAREALSEYDLDQETESAKTMAETQWYLNILAEGIKEKPGFILTRLPTKGWEH